MPYRSWVAATALGLATLGLPEQGEGQIQQERPSSEKYYDAWPPLFGADQFFNPPPIERPCPPGEDRRYSDLCAQWKAADAAKESADYTRLAFILGAVGLPIAIGTLLAAIAAARWARVAGEAGKDAVSVTRQIGIAQARAYLSIAEVRGIETTDGEGEPVFQVNPYIKNSGQSPAKDVRVTVTDRETTVPEGPSPSTVLLGDVGSGAEKNVPFTVRPINYSPERQSIVLAPKVTVTYQDVFGSEETVAESYWRRLYARDRQWFVLDKSNTRSYTINLKRGAESSDQD